MATPLKRYQRLFYMSMILIALGVTFNTTMSEEVGSLGIVMIAIGGLFFIMAMSQKREESD